MKRLHGERNIEWLGRVNVRLEQIEAELAALPPDQGIAAGAAFPDVEAEPATALEEEREQLLNYQRDARAAAVRDGDLEVD